MRVQASDNGITPRTGVVDVFITVIRYPGAPSLGPDPCGTSISENVQVGTTLLTLRATDSNTAVSSHNMTVLGSALLAFYLKRVGFGQWVDFYMMCCS